MKHIAFTDENGTFTLEQPEEYSELYFPVAGENGLKSALTPNLGGDCKLDQNSFLLEPVSVENLHNNRSVRNFWVQVEGVGLWSAVGASARQEAQRFTPQQEESRLTAGFLWQRVERTSKEFGLAAEVASFVWKNAEVMAVTLRNCAGKPLRIQPTAAIPLYGRSADNIRDHRHVTSLLNRISTTQYGVCLKPTLSFDERGHQKNERLYFVCGVGGQGEAPIGFYPTVEGFIGDGGTLTHPRALLCDAPYVPAGSTAVGKEALGGIVFAARELAPQETVSYTILLGTALSPDEIDAAVQSLNTREKVEKAFDCTARHWREQVNVRYHTADVQADNYLKWISFQPILRRIYGCSFLPHHDYGRGGRGWRDLWQDCLSLLIMDPSGVRKMLLNHFEGVRVDGTNATIIGTQPGEFLADRNGIARVWMDHGVWPLLTTNLYIHQTGDPEFLLEKTSYFKDEQKNRGTDLDRLWTPEDGLRLKTEAGEVYRGTVLEHILLEHLCACCDLGAHGHIRLRGADWNDALDMAAANGESVAFTCAYAGNLETLAELLGALHARGCGEVELLEEMKLLLSDEAETERLRAFTERCAHTVSGRTVRIETAALAASLRAWAERMRAHIRSTEWICGENEGWFNSYYDNGGAQVEGYFPNGVRMMLTGQTFAIMSGTATDDQTAKICRAAGRYLYRPEVGGYRLNTDFGELKLDLGRMFGFAYGEKENGAVFSHMTVMYANALYRRGFVHEGYRALRTLLNTAMDFDTSRIYPGIPEYFNADGRGKYHYLTGAASWYMLTCVTEMFGVRGHYGALEIAPRLVREQFDGAGEACLSLTFDGKRFTVTLKNPQHRDYGAYRVLSARCGSAQLPILDGKVTLSREALAALPDEETHITVELG